VCEKYIQICGKKLNVKARLYETMIVKGIKEKEVNASEMD